MWRKGVRLWTFPGFDPISDTAVSAMEGLP
jgi:hypothetical protein